MQFINNGGQRVLVIKGSRLSEGLSDQRVLVVNKLLEVINAPVCHLGPWVLC